MRLFSELITDQKQGASGLKQTSTVLGPPLIGYSPTSSVQYFLPDGDVAEARP